MEISSVETRYNVAYLERRRWRCALPVGKFPHLAGEFSRRDQQPIVSSQIFLNEISAPLLSQRHMVNSPICFEGQMTRMSPLPLLLKWAALKDMRPLAFARANGLVRECIGNAAPLGREVWTHKMTTGPHRIRFLKGFCNPLLHFLMGNGRSESPVKSCSVVASSGPRYNAQQFPKPVALQLWT